MAKPVRYISRYLQLRIVRKPGYSKEIDGQRISTPGTSIQFDQGVFETNDPAEVAFIESRPEYGKYIQRVPDNIENMSEEREKKFATLEQKEAEIAAREKALEEREKALTGAETGRAEGSSLKDETGDDGLDAMKRDQLVEIAKQEGLEEEAYKVGTKNTDIVAAIRAKRADTAAFQD